MKKVLVLMAGLLLIGANLYAGNGDLIVNGKVGVGTTTPGMKLDVRGDNYRLSNNTVTKEFSVDFPNAVANQKVDFYMTGAQIFWGTLEVTVTDSYSYQNAAGLIKKVYGLGLNPGGWIYSNEARYTEALGAAPDNWALSNLSWDATNLRYKITLVHRTSTGNIPIISIKAFVKSYIDSAITFTVGSIYTTDATVYGRPYEHFNNAIGIGTPNPQWTLDVNGSAHNLYGVWSTSDIKFKKDILPIDSALDKILKLGGVSFEWIKDKTNKEDVSTDSTTADDNGNNKDEKDKIHPEDGRHYGVIAQEIEKVLPEVVREDKEGNKAVAYTEIIPVLIEAMKEQQKQITDQQKKIEELEKKVAQLK